MRFSSLGEEPFEGEVAHGSGYALRVTRCALVQSQRETRYAKRVTHTSGRFCVKQLPAWFVPPVSTVLAGGHPPSLPRSPSSSPNARTEVKGLRTEKDHSVLSPQHSVLKLGLALPMFEFRGDLSARVALLRWLM